MTTYKSIFVSDIHLGTKDSKADLLNNFLKFNSCENLFLVGDIIDGWKVQQKKWHWKNSHTNLIRRFLTLSKKGTNITYITGNHDEFLRPFVGAFSLGNINIVNSSEYRAINGEKYLIVHGDMFDGVARLAPWLSFLGDKAYDFVLWLNTKFNWWRHKFGFGYWSLSKFLKHRVKRALDFMFKFENTISNYATKRNFDGVICGHIHTPEIKIINGIIYMNDGDWVESCSALVENWDGRWEIVYWTEEKKDVVIAIDSSARKQSQ
jgi:UDP-2,3-diacylglucosamine pyrophosphatase LpxH